MAPTPAMANEKELSAWCCVCACRTRRCWTILPSRCTRRSALRCLRHRHHTGMLLIIVGSSGSSPPSRHTSRPSPARHSAAFDTQGERPQCTAATRATPSEGDDGGEHAGRTTTWTSTSEVDWGVVFVAASSDTTAFPSDGSSPPVNWTLSRRSVCTPKPVFAGEEVLHS